MIQTAEQRRAVQKLKLTMNYKMLKRKRIIITKTMMKFKKIA